MSTPKSSIPKNCFADCLWGGTITVMNFWEKLDRLTAEIGKAKASELAGLPSTAISNYISKHQHPRIDAAFKLAKALGVSLDWLLNDEADFPAERSPKPSLRQAEPDDLVFEVAYRQRQHLARILQALEVAKKTDWRQVRDAMLNWKQGNSIPPQASSLSNTVAILTWEPRWIDVYDPRKAATLHHAQLIGSNRQASEFAFPAPEERLEELNKNADYVASAGMILSAVTGHNLTSGLQWMKELLKSPPPSTSPASPDQTSPMIPLSSFIPKTAAPPVIMTHSGFVPISPPSTPAPPTSKPTDSPTAPSSAVAPPLKHKRKRETKPQNPTPQPQSRDKK